jgi:tetratricopeptide (TPR) repeat protein
MQSRSAIRRGILAALTLLSACAAADPSSLAATDAQRRTSRGEMAGIAAAFLTGRFAAAEGDIDHAASQFLRALGSDPSSSELREQAFMTALLAGRPEAVRLAAMLPDSQPGTLLLANADAKAGRWEQAEARVSALPNAGLAVVLQPLLTAWIQAGEGRTAVALGTLAAAPNAQRLRGLYTLHGAMIADLGRQNAEAARMYRLAAQDYGDADLQLTRQIASWQMREGHAEEARQSIQALTDTNSSLALIGPGLLASAGERQVRNATDGMAEAYMSLAGALRGRERQAFSAVLVQLALDLRPDLTSARLLASELYDGRNKPDLALAALAPVASGDPLLPLVRMRQAALTSELGNTSQALRMLDDLARAHSDRPEIPTLQGDLLRTQKRFAEAVSAYDKAVSLLNKPYSRADWGLFYNRGIALDRAHQWARAEADFIEALRLQPEQPYVMNYLGYSWTEQDRNLARARDMIERAVRQRPDDGEIIDSLGWVLYRQGDYKSAVKYLERASELQPEDPTINGHLGDAYMAAGRKLEAQFQWRRALTLKPDPEEIPKLQAKLRESGDSIPQ